MSSQDRQMILLLMRLYRDPDEELFHSICKEFIDRLITENDDHQYDDLIEFVDMLASNKS